MPESTAIHSVDDDVDFLKAIARLLTAHDLRVRTYASAEEFRMLADLTSTSCLILDVHLGGISGIDLVQELSRANSTTPVIFVTAHDSEPMRRAAIAAGCSAFLAKPISAKILMAAVRKALQGSDS